MLKVDIMTLHYSNPINGDNYKREVKAITFTGGVLYVIVKDEHGNEYCTSYTEDSLSTGIISIF